MSEVGNKDKIKDAQIQSNRPKVTKHRTGFHGETIKDRSSVMWNQQSRQSYH